MSNIILMDYLKGGKNMIRTKRFLTNAEYNFIFLPAKEL
jgi:hypothetical protein